TAGLVVNEKMIKRHIDEELPFMATENILMEAVKAGGDRQELHEKIRQFSMEAGKRVKEEGLDNNLISLIEGDESFRLGKNKIQELLDAGNFIGRAPEQVEEFLAEHVYPLLEKNKDKLNITADLKV
ncbi:MAG TPA: adenylosuccinate lyase, partial [Bacillota bacterium]|nr:adenylosuccinate lyase [Bacillota bacterium]